MKLSQVRNIALRLTVPQQNAAQVRQAPEKLVSRTAFLLAGLGVGVSSFSLKQLLLSKGALK